MKKISIVYWSGTGNTEVMAQAVSKGAQDNCEVKLVTVEEATKEDILNADAVAIGCPSMGAEELEPEYMEPFIASFENIDLNNKPMILFGSYDWGDGEWMREWDERMKKYGANILEEGLIAHLTPEGEDLSKCEEIGKKLANA
ncbi:MAG: flavodoxin [Tepidibacter sp.]|jgi:flavodoxin short chain|uniref:flavodoxin n=1 Tax=Tepidibacter sp. TaxID=2529387 RepID=UPI0025F6CDB3|nr:flavodoxin [Tepidibacter sp.]MCT4508870.1 flavodoxin [Tepidibacter sp.]